MPAAVVLLFLSLILRRLYHIAFAEWLILPIFLFLLYYLTIGRNDYLTLVQSETW
jgi:hypothetical protein